MVKWKSHLLGSSIHTFHPLTRNYTRLIGGMALENYQYLYAIRDRIFLTRRVQWKWYCLQELVKSLCICKAQTLCNRRRRSIEIAGVISTFSSCRNRFWALQELQVSQIFILTMYWTYILWNQATYFFTRLRFYQLFQVDICKRFASDLQKHSNEAWVRDWLNSGRARPFPAPLPIISVPWFENTSGFVPRKQLIKSFTVQEFVSTSKEAGAAHQSYRVRFQNSWKHFSGTLRVRIWWPRYSKIFEMLGRESIYCFLDDKKKPLILCANKFPKSYKSRILESRCEIEKSVKRDWNL